MTKNIIKGKIIVEFDFEGLEVPESFNWNEIDEAVKDAFKRNDCIDFDSAVIKEINYAPFDEWEDIEEEDEEPDEEWEKASLQYDAWKCGDYDEKD